MSRFSAASVHLLACVVVAALLFAFLWFVWYPEPLFRAMGGQDIFFMLVGVDVVLGPLLTFIVFKPGKRSLRFDLGVIVSLQLAALIYGVYTLGVARPVYIVGLGHRFDVIPANDVSEESLAVAKKSLPWFGPVWTGIQPPADPKERERVLFSAVAGGGDYGTLPQYHAPLRTMRDELLQRSKPLVELKKLNPSSAALIDAWLSERGYKPDDAVFQGLSARRQDMAVILDAKTAEVIGIAPFKPWD